MACLSILKNSSVAFLGLFFCSHISDSTFLSPSSTFKDPCDDSESEGCTVVSDSLQPHGLYSPLNSPGQNTGVGSCSILQGIFPILGSNTGFLHCRLILYQLSHHGNPRILKRVAFPFSRGSSQPRNWTRVSCIAGRFFTSWATREAPVMALVIQNPPANPGLARDVDSIPGLGRSPGKGNSYPSQDSCL